MFVYKERFSLFSNHCYGIKWTIYLKIFINYCNQSETFLSIKNPKLRRELKEKYESGLGIATLNFHKSIRWVYLTESFINTWVTSRITAKFIIMLNISSVFSLSVSFCLTLPQWKLSKLCLYPFILINNGESFVNIWFSLYISFSSLPTYTYKSFFRRLNAMHWKCCQSKKPCRNASKWKSTPTESYISFPPTPRISRTAVNASLSSIITIFTVINNDVTKQELWLQIKKQTMGVSGLFRIKDFFLCKSLYFWRRKHLMQMDLFLKKLFFKDFCEERTSLQSLLDYSSSVVVGGIVSISTVVNPKSSQKFDLHKWLLLNKWSTQRASIWLWNVFVQSLSFQQFIIFQNKLFFL